MGRLSSSLPHQHPAGTGEQHSTTSACGLPRVDLALACSRAEAHELFAQARTLAPVCRDLHEDCWIVLGHAEVLWALKNPKLLGNRFHKDFDPYVVGNDPPEHGQYRRLLGVAMNAFSPAAVSAFTEDWMDAWACRVQERSEALDLVQELACPLPEALMCRILGLEAADEQNLARLRPTNRTDLNFNRAAITEFFTDRTSLPPRGIDGVLQRLLAVGEGASLSVAEVAGLLRLLWYGGTSTSSHFLPSMLRLLLTRPGLSRRLVSQPDLVPRFVEEALRMEGPTAVIPRCARTDFALGRHHIRAGELVKLALLSANNDEKVFHHPRQLDLERSEAASLVFGHGLHHCLGAAVARSLATSVTAKFLQHFPTAMLVDPQAQPVFESSASFRALRRLDVRWS